VLLEGLVQAMELAGLQPATSWVRSPRGRDREGSNGMVKPFSDPPKMSLSPPFLASTHHQLTTPSRCVVSTSNGSWPIQPDAATS
jgi:hypothetical protein